MKCGPVGIKRGVTIRVALDQTPLRHLSALNFSGRGARSRQPLLHAQVVDSHAQATCLSVSPCGLSVAGLEVYLWVCSRYRSGEHSCAST
jgi:hypothetical protein